jgi:prepilin-type N-terminal cleavage/methylation domain-containing protein
MRSPNTERLTNAGFTLVEMAIVLMIVALLLGGLLPTISSQVEQRHENDTRKQLDEIQQALIGFAVINGRLPCPATSNSNGAEKFAVGHSAADGQCFNFYNGYIPAATLGISGANNAGLVLDSWGNPIRYAVTSWNSASPSLNDVFTTTNGMHTVGISNLAPTSLLVCSSSTASGFSSSSCGTNNALTTNGVPAVIFSTGKNGAQGSAGTDEAANLDNNQTFVSHLPSANFDDIVIWLSPNVLINRMVSAGKLP